MALEYQNGRRITKFVYELSPLEAAIQRYQETIDKHRTQIKKAPAVELKAGSKPYERSEELRKQALDHLLIEAKNLEKLSDVHAQLEAYRAAGEAALETSNRKASAQALRTMRSESHHPVGDLEKYMMAEGVPKPSPYHTAHHIVPGKGNEPQVNNQTRLHIHRHGIRINDPANGIYLLHKDEYTPHWSMPKSRGHLKYHTKAYERFLHDRVVTITNMDAIKTKLQVIGRLLQQNEPKDAIAKIKGR